MHPTTCICAPPCTGCVRVCAPVCERVHVGVGVGGYAPAHVRPHVPAWVCPHDTFLLYQPCSLFHKVIAPGKLVVCWRG